MDVKLNLRDRLYFALFLIVPIPLFFNLNGTIFRAGTFDFNAFGLPISFLFLSVITVLNFKRIDFLFHRDNILFLFFILMQIISFLLYNIIFTSNGDPLLLLISMVPLIFSYKVGFNINEVRNYEILNKYIRKSVLVCGFFSMLHLLSSFAKYGVIQSFAVRGNDDIFGLFSIYQKLVYYPTMLALFFVLSIYQKGKSIRVASVLILVAMLMVGSRESLIIATCGILSKMIWIKLFRRYKYLPLLFIGLVLLISLSGSYIAKTVETFSESGLVTKLRKLNQTGDYSAGRFDVMKKVFTDNKNDTFIGTGYSTQEGIISPHNQYLEFFLRSGVFSFFMFFLLLVKAYKNIYKFIKERENVPNFNTIFSLIIVFVLFSFIAFNINTPIRAPYTSCFFGVLLGFFNKKITYGFQKNHQARIS